MTVAPAGVQCMICLTNAQYDEEEGGGRSTRKGVQGFCRRTENIILRVYRVNHVVVNGTNGFLQAGKRDK